MKCQNDDISPNGLQTDFSTLYDTEGPEPGNLASQTRSMDSFDDLGYILVGV